MDILDPELYTIAWLAPLEVEAQAALHMLDNRHRGRFPLSRGDDHVFLAGEIGGHNIVIATLPAGQEYGTGSAAALASAVKMSFPNLWLGLLVGVAAGLPNLSRIPPRDIRLGDVLVGLSTGETRGTDSLLRGGYALADTETIVRSAIGKIKLMSPNDADIFMPHYEKIKDIQLADATGGTFADPGQEHDKFYLIDKDDGTEHLVERPRRPDSNRVRVWYGPIGSREKVVKSARIRDQLRDRYDLIGLEMEAAGTMTRIPVGVIRGVCDYADRHKNKIWQPYAAAMAAAYAKAIICEIGPRHRPQKAKEPDLGSSGRATQMIRRFGFDKQGNDMRGSERVGIYWAALNGYEDVVLVFLENNANPERKSSQKTGGVSETALHAAVSKGHDSVVKLLVEWGADLEARDSDNWTPLHRAARSGQTKTLELLFDLGADCFATGGDKGYTIQHCIVEEGSDAMEEALMRWAVKNIQL